jgi:GNAT superfamily N-acetyltransferase
MKIELRPFDRDRDIDIAAKLLAERHQRDRLREPMFPQAFEDPAVCRSTIEHAFDAPGWSGVVAYAGGTPAGFAIVTVLDTPATHLLANFFPPRAASLGYANHAARDGIEYDVYRAMFAELAGPLVERGYFEFGVNIPAADLAAREAWVSLGFGRVMTCAIRGVGPTERAAAPGIELHQSAAEDAEVVFRLGEELTIHHARSPIFNPYMRESDAASHDFQTGLLAEPDANAHWVAYEGGRPVGMNTFMQPFFLSPLTVPEKTIYLFQGIVTEDVRAGGVGTAVLARGVAWAREQGYQHVALHFASANVPGAKFWQSSGFHPVEHGMRRHIDERIAWANR